MTSENKLCIICEKLLSINDRIVIDSVVHVGIKNAIMKKVSEKKLILSDLEPYSVTSIHMSCYDKIEKKIS